MKRILIIGAVIAGLGIFVYAASRRSGAVSVSSLSSGSDGSQLKAAPDFALRTLDGRTVKLSDFRGKAVVLNFWATYCGPCRVEMPWLRDLYKRYRDSGLEVIGISMDDDGEQKQVADFVQEIGINYTILLGNHSVADAYGGARFLPQTFFINRDGQIVASVTGMKSKKEFQSSINQLLSAGR